MNEIFEEFHSFTFIFLPFLCVENGENAAEIFFPPSNPTPVHPALERTFDIDNVTRYHREKNNENDMSEAASIRVE